MRNIINCLFPQHCWSGAPLILFRATLFSRIYGGYYPHELSLPPRPSRDLLLSVYIVLVVVRNHGLSLVAGVVWGEVLCQPL